jgi:hypothetical protein
MTHGYEWFLEFDYVDMDFDFDFDYDYDQDYSIDSEWGELDYNILEDLGI